MASQRVVMLDEMGPTGDNVLAFVEAVFRPAEVKRITPELVDGADVLVCGDWRANPHITNQHGGIALAEVLDRVPPPATLIYFLLGAGELSRAMRPRARGVPAIDGWRRIVDAGGRVIILQIRRMEARKPFTPADAAEILPTIAPRTVVQWHEPHKPIAI